MLLYPLYVVYGIRYIQFALNPLWVVLFPKGSPWPFFQLQKILQGTLYPVYVTAYEVYKICHLDGLEKRKATTKVVSFYKSADLKWERNAKKFFILISYELRFFAFSSHTFKTSNKTFHFSLFDNSRSIFKTNSQHFCF